MRPFTLADLESAVAEAISARGQPDVVPDGWYTIRQLSDVIARKRNLNPHARHCRRLAGEITDGKQRRMFRVRNGERGVYPVIHYLMTP